MHDAEAHGLERGPQRQHKAILAQGHELVLQIGRVFLGLQQAVRLAAHPGRHQVALTAQAPQIGRGPVAQLAGRIEGLARHAGKLVVVAQTRSQLGHARRLDAWVLAGDAAVETASAGRGLAEVRHLAQFLGPERRPLRNRLQVRLDLGEAQAGQRFAKPQQGLQFAHLRHALACLGRRFTQGQSLARRPSARRIGLRGQSRAQLGPVEKLAVLAGEGVWCGVFISFHSTRIVVTRRRFLPSLAAGGVTGMRSVFLNRPTYTVYTPGGVCAGNPMRSRSRMCWPGRQHSMG